MAFTDNAKKFLSDTAKTIVKKSNDLYESAKNKYNEYDLQNNIDNLYKDLGKLVYTGYKEDVDVSETIQGVCSEIDAYMDKLSFVSNKNECPACSSICKPDAAYCHNCGEKLN